MLTPFFSILRLCGVGLALIFTVDILFGTRSLLISEAGVPAVAAYILDRAFLLALAAILILSALHLQIGFAKAEQLIPNQLPPRFYLRTRPLLLLILVLFLTLIPSLIVQRSTSRTITTRILMQQYEQKRSIIAGIAAAPSIEKAISDLQLYQRTFPVSVPVLPATRGDLRRLVRELHREADASTSKALQQAGYQARQSLMRLCAIDALYMAIFLALWYIWP